MIESLGPEVDDEWGIGSGEWEWQIGNGELGAGNAEYSLLPALDSPHMILQPSTFLTHVSGFMFAKGRLGRGILSFAQAIFGTARKSVGEVIVWQRVTRAGDFDARTGVPHFGCETLEFCAVPMRHNSEIRGWGVTAGAHNSKSFVSLIEKVVRR